MQTPSADVSVRQMETLRDPVVFQHHLKGLFHYSAAPNTSLRLHGLCIDGDTDGDVNCCLDDG